MYCRVIPGLLFLVLDAVQFQRTKAFSPSLPFARIIQTNPPKHDHDLSRRTSLQPSSLAMDHGGSNEDLIDRTPGKIVVERFLYRFSPTSSSVQSPYTIEERHYFSVAADRSLRSFGGTSYIFRRGEFKDDNVRNRLYTKIGSPIFAISGMQDGGSLENLGEQFGDSSLAMALFCMQHPEIVGGKGLELGSGFGIGGILSVIGAGIASDAASNAENHDEESLTAPTPSALSEIILTDCNELLLNKCLDNLESSSFDVSKVNLRLKRHQCNEMKNEFNFVLGCDSANAHDVAPLAKSIAYSLQSTNFDEFLHIEPEENERGLSSLREELEKGYRMNTMRNEIVMERLHLLPLNLNSLDEVEGQMNDEVERNPGSFVEFQNMRRKRYSALFGCHNEAYNGLNGEHFFPASQHEAEMSKHQDVEQALIEEQARNHRDMVIASGEERRVRAVYRNWCNVYRRQPDEDRFYTFAYNFLELENYYNQIGSKMQFHKYLDCTEEESISLSTGKTSEYANEDDEIRFSARAAARLREISTAIEIKQRAKLEARMQKEAEEREQAKRVHAVYSEWCEVYGKEENDERFETFLYNFNAMEAHADATGKTMVLNQWYDCTEEEHKLAIEAQEKAKAEEESKVAARAAALELAEEQAKLAASAQLKIREKALEHKAKALEQRKIAGEYWKKAEEQARLAAEVEAKAKAEDKLIVAAEDNVQGRALEQATVVKEQRMTLRENAAQIQHRAIVASRHHMRTSETERMARVQEIYLEWCDVFGKKAEESLFRNFASNFIVMEEKAKETGEALELNQFYDCNEEEFTKNTEPQPHPSLSSIVEYVEDDSEEAVVPEVFEAEQAIRQAWYHCTEEEHEALTSGRAIVKIQLAEDTIKEALDVNFIEADATVGNPMLPEGIPVAHQEPSTQQRVQNRVHNNGVQNRVHNTAGYNNAHVMR